MVVGTARERRKATSATEVVEATEEKESQNVRRLRCRADRALAVSARTLQVQTVVNRGAGNIVRAWNLDRQARAFRLGGHGRRGRLKRGPDPSALEGEFPWQPFLAGRTRERSGRARPLRAHCPIDPLWLCNCGIRNRWPDRIFGQNQAMHRTSLWRRL